MSVWLQHSLEKIYQLFKIGRTVLRSLLSLLENYTHFQSLKNRQSSVLSARTDDPMERGQQKSNMPWELLPGDGLCVKSCGSLTLSSSSGLQICLRPSYKGTGLERITSKTPFPRSSWTRGNCEKLQGISKPAAVLEGRCPEKPPSH